MTCGGPRLKNATIIYTAYEATPVEVAVVTAADLGLLETADVWDWLEKIWRTMKCITRDPRLELCLRLNVRSLAVGDQVRFDDGRTYRSAVVGWALIAHAT